MLRRVNDGRKSFEEWYSRLPENKRDTTHYNLRRAYELAPREQLDSFVNDPNAHLYSSYLNPETGNYEFMKSKDHPTIDLELDWFYSDDGSRFRKDYDLDTTGNHYKYIRKNNIKSILNR